MASNRPHQDADGEVAFIEEEKKWIFKPWNMNIVWGRDNRYWNVPSKGSGDPAELQQVCWLEVTASTDLEPGKKYEISFSISMKPEAFGWMGCPVLMMAKIGRKGKYKWTKIYLQDQGSEKRETIPTTPFQIEVPATGNNQDHKLYFGLYEVWTGRWKGGLKIYEAEVKEVS